MPIEEDAYLILKDYISSLQRQFSGDESKEIIEDIENRIAELFSIRLQSGSPAIDREDVKKVMDTLGAPGDIKEGASTSTGNNTRSGSGNFYSGSQNSRQWQAPRGDKGRLLRDPYNKVIGGVCSGLAHYFDIDPVIIRLILAVLFLTAGIGFIAYIIAWIVIPAARSREELYNMNNGQPITFHDITRNVGEELNDLKHRGEQMSRELRDFFSKKK